MAGRPPAAGDHRAAREERERRPTTRAAVGVICMAFEQDDGSDGAGPRRSSRQATYAVGVGLRPDDPLAQSVVQAIKHGSPES